MPLTVDWPNKLITVPQGDLTLISGTLFSMDTENYFRQSLMALMDDADGIAYDTPMSHFRAPTIAGIDYGRFIEVINGYMVQFTPNSPWSVILNGSNNNIWDIQGGVLVQNQVQVIPTNSAGLQIVTQGSGVTAQDIIDIATEVWSRDLGNTALSSSELMQTIAAAVAGTLTGALPGSPGSITVRRVNEAGETIITLDYDANGNRSNVVVTPPGD